MHAIVLAHEKSFAIGPLSVHPSTRTVNRGNRVEILEPRVMQVLAVLGDRPGEVISRDDLVQSCWNGRIVGDDAVNRVIARLRHVAEGIGDGVFAIDTITRVGYRLRLLDDSAIERMDETQDRPSGRRHLTRRELIGGGAAAAGAAALGAGWLLFRPRTGSQVSPETAALLQQAQAQLWQNTREGQNQAIALYRQIVANNPDYADGWGFLSLAYGWTSHFRQTAEAAMLQERARSAGKRALAIEPRNPLALSGLAGAQPIEGHWLEIDRALRDALSGPRRRDEVLVNYAYLLCLVGRSREALKYMKGGFPALPSPGLFYYQSQLLWAAGREEESDELLAQGSRLYPTHFGIWFSRFYFDMYTGRPEAALALAADTGSRPTGIDPEEIASVVRVASALQSRSPPAIDEVASEWMERAHHGAGYAENAAQFMSALGRIDDALAVLRAYYFSEGFDCGEVRFSSLQGTYTPHNDRLTGFLFLPSLAAVRADPRFGELMKRLGLADYWRQSGVQPDYIATRV